MNLCTLSTHFRRLCTRCPPSPKASFPCPPPHLHHMQDPVHAPCPDVYDPNFIPNTSDDEGLYRYNAQPSICYKNLDKLGVPSSLCGNAMATLPPLCTLTHSLADSGRTFAKAIATAAYTER